MGGDRFHEVLSDQVLAKHVAASKQIWSSAQQLNKEWTDLAQTYGEDPKTAQPEAFLSSIAKFLDLLDKSRAEALEQRRKREVKLLPQLLEKGPNAPVFQPNTALERIISEQEKQEEISKRFALVFFFFVVAFYSDLTFLLAERWLLYKKIH